MSRKPRALPLALAAAAALIALAGCSSDSQEAQSSPAQAAPTSVEVSTAPPTTEGPTALIAPTTIVKGTRALKKGDTVDLPLGTMDAGADGNIPYEVNMPETVVGALVPCLWGYPSALVSVSQTCSDLDGWISGSAEDLLGSPGDLAKAQPMPCVQGTTIDDCAQALDSLGIKLYQGKTDITVAHTVTGKEFVESSVVELDYAACRTGDTIGNDCSGGTKATVRLPVTITLDYKGGSVDKWRITGVEVA